MTFEENTGAFYSVDDVVENEWAGYTGSGELANIDIDHPDVTSNP